jgi:hypothetical protein
VICIFTKILRSFLTGPFSQESKLGEVKSIKYTQESEVMKVRHVSIQIQKDKCINSIIKRDDKRNTTYDVTQRMMM